MNAYFQLVADGNSTAVRLVPPTDGGEKLNIAELTEYLHLKKLYCLKELPYEILLLRLVVI